jgi:hypothetical protein
MKKWFLLLMVFAVAAPSVSYLCSCCPPSGPENTAVPVLSSGDCDCCPEAIRNDEKTTARQDNLRSSFLASSGRGLHSLPSVAGVFITTNFGFEASLFHFGDSGPPDRFSETPLYLAHRILRL